MTKIIFLIIILILVAIIVWLLKGNVSFNNIQNPRNLSKFEIDRLIIQLKEKINMSKQDAIDGKQNASEKVSVYEAQLKNAEELIKKFN